MDILNPTQCERWLADHNLSKDPKKQPFWFSGPHVIILLMPAAAESMQLQFVKEIIHLLGNSKFLFWITDWPLYTDSQMDFFDNFRKSLGLYRRLIDAPGHLISMAQRDGDDQHYLSELILMILRFNWEGYLYQISGEEAIWFADEVIEIDFKDIKKRELLLAAVTRLNIKVLVDRRPK